MKNLKVIVISFGLISAITLMSFNMRKDSKSKTINIKEIDKSLVKIKDKLYAGKFEVSNKLYREFLHDLMIKNKKELYLQVLVDSLNWRDKTAYNEPFVELYFRHPAYSNYPLVNVSYESAIKYCDWLTDTYNSSPNKKFKKVKFRLPTEPEWEFAAKGGLENCEYAWGNRLLLDNKINCNFRYVGDENLEIDTITNKIVVDYTNNTGIAGTLNDNADITAPVDSYKPNKYGLYNMCGNISEMIQVKGISKGGGWKSPGGDVKIKSKAKYNKSAVDVGFRYFMEIIEE